MNAKYNLNDKVGGDSFSFSIGGFTYEMAYPSSRELLKIMDLADEVSSRQDRMKALTERMQAGETGLDEELSALGKDDSNETFLDWCVKYIKSERDDAPGIKDHILDKNVKYLIAFVDMVKTEFSTLK